MSRLCARPGCEQPVKRAERRYCSLACAHVVLRKDRGSCEVCGTPLRGQQKRLCSQKCQRTWFDRQRPAGRGEAFQAQVRALWLSPERPSINAIGRALGVSKNVIAGLRNRLGLPPRGSPIKPGSGEPYVRKPRRIRRAPRITLPPLEVVPRPPRPKAPLAAPRAVIVPPPTPVVVVPFPASPFRSCQWPETDGRPWRFCDKPTRAGSAYCAAHHARCYTRRAVAA